MTISTARIVVGQRQRLLLFVNGRDRIRVELIDEHQIQRCEILLRRRCVGQCRCLCGYRLNSILARPALHLSRFSALRRVSEANVHRRRTTVHRARMMHQGDGV